jgi:hypothetical protein
LDFGGAAGDGAAERTDIALEPPRPVQVEMLMPLCLGAFGSVRTKVNKTSASWAPDVHTFCQLTTKSSPSNTARVRREARSDPAPGSLIPSDAVISARRIGTAHRRCCSGDPKEMSDAEMMPTPCGLNVR